MRVNTGALRLRIAEDQAFDLLAAVRTVRRAGPVRSWDMQAIDPQSHLVPGRVCVLQKTREAIRHAHRGLRREASCKGRTVQPQTREFAKGRRRFKVVQMVSIMPYAWLSWIGADPLNCCKYIDLQ